MLIYYYFHGTEFIYLFFIYLLKIACNKNGFICTNDISKCSKLTLKQCICYAKYPSCRLNWTWQLRHRRGNRLGESVRRGLDCVAETSPQIKVRSFLFVRTFTLGSSCEVAGRFDNVGVFSWHYTFSERYFLFCDRYLRFRFGGQFERAYFRSTRKSKE